MSGRDCTRRTLLRLGLTGVAITGLGATLNGCGSASTAAATAPLRTSYTGDAAVAALLHAAESAQLAAISAATTAAVAGHYGSVPAAFTAALGNATAHHLAHQAQWQTALAAAGFAAPTAVLLAAEVRSLATVSSALQACVVFAGIQAAVTATYLAASQQATLASTRRLCAAIGPVEAEHGVAWQLLAGQSVSFGVPGTAGALTLPDSGH